MINTFISEILEQPAALGSTLEHYAGGDGRRSLVALGSLVADGSYTQIIFTGMGSSYFVSYAAACMFNGLGFHSVAVNTSELLYYNISLITKTTLLVCISQSGESAEIVKLLKALPTGTSVVGVTNDPTSTLAAAAHAVLLSKAGREEMTSTKTFTSMTMLMRIAGLSLAGRWGADAIADLKAVVAGCERVITRFSHAGDELAAFFGDCTFIQFIGRGPSFSTACQCELMFKEAARLASAGTLGGEFRHGPMEMVAPGFNAVLFAVEGVTYNHSITMAADIARLRGKVMLITNKDPQLTGANIKTIVIDQPGEYAFTIPNIIPIQFMVNHVAMSRGLVPGIFTAGGKVTLSE